MKTWLSTFSRIGLAGLATVILVSCAQYSLKSDKAPEFSAKLTTVYVWSGMSSVQPFNRKLLFSGETFDNQFNSALAKKLTESGVKNELRHFSPNTDSATDLARFEGALNPDYRLLVVSPRYTTINGLVDVLNLNISVIRTKDNQRVWWSDIVISTNGAPGQAWREPGAIDLAGQIINALKKDGLI